MVRIEGESRSEDERLDALVRGIAAELGLVVQCTGWTRRTYELYETGRDPRERPLLLRVESFAVRSGEITLLHERGVAAARAIGEGLESEFDVSEAVIRRPRTN